MNEIPEPLVRLNEDLFFAEDKKEVGPNREQWESFLRRVLAADFRISRASRTVQNKDEMIEQIKRDERVREGPSDVGGSVQGEYGVVTSTVRVKGDPETYLNFKVFDRQSGDWQCVYWRVTKLNRR